MSIPKNKNSSSESGQPAAERQELLPVGQLVFGKFEILDTLGAGGVGTVYKVRQTLMDRIMALKVLNSHAGDQSAVVRFQNEARTLSRLKHPAIAMIYDFGVEGGRPYMAIEFLEGQSLEARLATQGPLNINEFLSVFIEVCAALAFSHENGIVHRDIKPGNIMLTPPAVSGEPAVKVLDFGLAKTFDEASIQQLTVDGSIIGTPLYMSPEQAEGAQATFKSDMYSLGCVMFECLTGEPPYVRETAIETLLCHQSGDFPKLIDRLASTNEISVLHELISKLTNKEPNQRFENLAQVTEILRRLHDDSTTGGVTPPTDYDTEDGSADRKPIFTMQPDPSAKRKQRVFITVLGVLLLGAVMAISLNLFGSGQTSSEKIKAEMKVFASAPSGIATDLPAPQKTVETMKSLMKRHASKFYLDRHGLGNDDLKPFENYDGNPTYISLEDNFDISDKGLKHLEGLKELRELNLNGTTVETLAGLKSLTSLEVLKLRNTRITDRSLDNVQALSRLTKIDLRDTKISAIGLKKLLGLDSLNNVPYNVRPDEKDMKDYLELLKSNPKSKIFDRPQVEEIRTRSKQLETEEKFAESLACAAFVYDVHSIFSTYRPKDLGQKRDDFKLIGRGKRMSKLLKRNDLYLEWCDRGIARAERLGTEGTVIDEYNSLFQHMLQTDPARSRSVAEKFFKTMARLNFSDRTIAAQAAEFGNKLRKYQAFTDSIKWYDLAVAKMKEKSEDEVLYAIYRCDRAHSLVDAHLYDKARPETIAALDVLKRIETPGPDEAAKIGLCWLDLSRIESSHRKYKEGFDANEKALKILDRYGDVEMSDKNRQAKQYLFSVLQQKIGLLGRLHSDKGLAEATARLKELQKEFNI